MNPLQIAVVGLGRMVCLFSLLDSTKIKFFIDIE